MPVVTLVRKKFYQDSLRLMAISNRVKEIDGVEEAMVAMATETNVDILKGLELFTIECQSAGVDDIIIVIKARDEEVLKRAIKAAQDELSGKGKDEVCKGESVVSIPQTIESAVKNLPKANLAVISVPGRYAAYEANKALNLGLNVMIFSDNVSIEDEMQLKKKAQAKNIIVMGPDCGTVIINGIKLGFANAVRSGPIGIVAASGTGIQEASVIIDSYGSGISHAIGTGGRDLCSEVGGITTLQAIDLLEKDEFTKLLLIISKPPDRIVSSQILQRIKKCKKPVVINFLGMDMDEISDGGIITALTIEDAAIKAVKMLQLGKVNDSCPVSVDNCYDSYTIAKTLKKCQKFIHAYYSGGTLAYEALTIFKDKIKVYSNLDLVKNFTGCEDNGQHVVLDLGDDKYTVGKAHPMIDPEVRNRLILEKAKNSEIAIIMIDVVLGYGAHPDPAREIASIIKKIRDKGEDGSNIVFLAHVCGTEKDQQVLSKQEMLLKEAGIYIFKTNAEMVRFSLKVMGCLDPIF